MVSRGPRLAGRPLKHWKATPPGGARAIVGRRAGDLDHLRSVADRVERLRWNATSVPAGKPGEARFRSWRLGGSRGESNPIPTIPVPATLMFLSEADGAGMASPLR
jgi:hypothetical protein